MNGTSSCRIIALIGPKHSGKTSTGEELSLLLKADFMDLDLFIEERTGKTPRTLYMESPGIFMEAEAQALEAVINRTAQNRTILVLSTGGGIIDNPAAVSLLREKTLMVFLEVSSGTAWDRILGTSKISGELPPFLRTDNPEETHRELHTRRNRLYRELADYTVDAESADLAGICRDIKQYAVHRLGIA